MNIKEQKLVEIIKKSARCFDDKIEIKDDIHLVDDLGMDSVSLIMLIVDLEEEFNIDFESKCENLDDILTYGSLKSVIMGEYL